MCFVLIKEINKRKNVAKDIKSQWDYFFKIGKSEIIPIGNIEYPFWENNAQNETEITTHRAVVTDISNNDVTICMENLITDRSECYVLNRRMFDFNINVEDIVELIVENSPGQSCIKTRKYIKSKYYKDKEDELILQILNSNEDDDF